MNDTSAEYQHKNTARRNSAVPQAAPQNGMSSLHAVAQLQRIQGNRRTVQMMRGTPQAQPAVKQSLPNSGKLIQPDRLVEIQGGNDLDDFNMVRGQVTASIGIETSGNWVGNRFDVGHDEVLYLWGHTDESEIGTVEYSELAEIMVEQGFTGCKAIRIIGCNNRDTPSVAPKALWDELTTQFNLLREEATDEEPAPEIVMPTIYATKGPLQSSAGEDFSKGWWVGVDSKKEKKFRQDLAYIIEYAKTGANPEGYNTIWLDTEAQRYEVKLGAKLTTLVTEASINKFIEKESAPARMQWRESGKVEYPTLKTEVDDGEGGTKLDWNPDAWVSYSG